LSKNKGKNQGDKPLKKRFTVGDGETLDECLDRMKREGYTPIRRTEQPIFRETANGPECIGRQCVLEGKLILSKDEQ
jgi:hypothetical protein